VRYATALGGAPVAIADQDYSLDRGATWQPLGIRVEAVVKDEASGRLIVAAQGGGIYGGRPSDWAYYGMGEQTLRALAISEGQLLAASVDGNIWRLSLNDVRDVWAMALTRDRTRNARPGVAITYHHVLNNVGTVTDTYDLSISPGWGTLLTSSPITVSPQSPAAVQLRVSVPEDAAIGASQRITLTATSRADPSVTDSVVDTTQVVSQHLVYLPYVVKNHRYSAGLKTFYLGQRSSSTCAEHDSYVVPIFSVLESDTMSAGTVLAADYRIRATHPATEVHPLGAPWSEWCDPDWTDCPEAAQGEAAGPGCIRSSDTISKVFDSVQEQIYVLDGAPDIGILEVVINGRSYGHHTGVVLGSRWGTANSWVHDGVIYANGFTRWKPKGEAPGAETDPCFGTSVILGPYQVDVPFLEDGYSPNPLRHPQIETIAITVDGGWEAQMTGAFFEGEQRLMDVTWSVKRLNIDPTEMFVSVSQRATARQDFSLYRMLGAPAIGQVGMSSMYADLHKHDADTQIGSGPEIPVEDISSDSEGSWGQESDLHRLTRGASLCLETRQPTTHNTGSPTLCVMWGSGEMLAE
jgi:hypothetical protein